MHVLAHHTTTHNLQMGEIAWLIAGVVVASLLVLAVKAIRKDRS
jgi:hypothetical protein